MTLPYFGRLICLGLACFFLLNLGIGLAVQAAMPSVFRRADRQSARRAARILLVLRLSPPVSAAVVVAFLCIPSYLMLESPGSAEDVGWGCLIAAGLALYVWMAGLLRGMAALVRSRRYVAENASRPLLLLRGILTTRLHVSDVLAKSLPSENLAVALRHEEAHRTSHDNLKRLILMIVPDLLPGLTIFKSLDRNWAKFAEWAADDEAVGGDRQRALLLAEALVRVARMGMVTTPAMPVSLLLTADQDLAARVDRLLGGAKTCEASRGNSLTAAAIWGGIAVSVVAMWARPEAMHPVHEFLEIMMH